MVLFGIVLLLLVLGATAEAVAVTVFLFSVLHQEVSMDMMARHRWIALALCVLACGAACSPADDRRSDDGPPDTLVAPAAEGVGPALPYVVDNVCPGEGCVFGTWLACGPVPGYAEAGDRATEVFRLSLNESFTVRTGQMRVAVPGLVVVREATPAMQIDSTVFAAGDTVYVLHYVGEGYFNVWYHGAEVQTKAFWTDAVGAAESAVRGMLLRERTVEYWVEAETAVGQHGWVLVEAGLVLAASVRDPTPPTCADAAFIEALRALREFNYTVVDSDRESGFIRAERRATGSTEEIVGDSVDYWLLSVSILSDSVGFRYVLQPDIRREDGSVRHRITGGHQAVLDSITARLDRN